MSGSAEALSEMTVAWVGLGRMGSAMASRLLDAGTPLAVWNRTAAKCLPLVEKGAEQLDTLAAAARSDAVFSMVLDDRALAALHDPDTGLLSGPAESRRARVWIDGSTVSSGAADAAARAAAAAGIAYVSAPISGNPGVVESGNAIFAISGGAAGLDIAEALCLRIGRGVHRVGSRSQANVVKLCTNAVLAVTMQSLAEIAVLADRVGVSRAALMALSTTARSGRRSAGTRPRPCSSWTSPRRSRRKGSVRTSGWLSISPAMRRFRCRCSPKPKVPPPDWSAAGLARTRTSPPSYSRSPAKRVTP